MPSRTFSRSRAISLLAAAGFLCASLSADAAPPYFRALIGVNGETLHSFAYALAADGTVIVGASGVSPGVFEATRWDVDRVPVGLGELPGGIFYSVATDVSSNGQVIVGSSVSMPPSQNPFGLVYEAFRWDAVAGIVALGDLPGGVFDSAAYAISDDAVVVVGQGASDNGVEPFRWTAAEGMVGLGTLPGGDWTAGRATDVSSDGSVAVGATRSLHANGYREEEAFRWTQKLGMIGLGDLPGGPYSSTASAVSADGLTVVGRSSYTSQDLSYDYQAFRWTEAGGMAGLGFLPTHDLSVAEAVSADGAVILGYSAYVSRGPVSPTHAFIWDAAHGIRDLKTVLQAAGVHGLDEWELTNAIAISPDARTIVGTGSTTGGSINHAWVVRFDYPFCQADWNRDEVVTSQDFFDFVVSFFDADADFNGDGGVNSQDLFDFLAAFFSGC